MKKFIFLLTAAAILALTAGCNRNQIAEMESEIESLRAEKDLAASLQDQFLEFLTDVENNLAEIRSKEQVLSKVANERPQNQQDRILQDLADISELMDRSRARLGELENLRRQMRAANQNTQRMQEMIDALTARVEAQEQQIRELQERLRIANERIEVLVTEKREITEESERRQARIEEQTIELNTAYWTMGTSQELRENGVITRSGGFIGIGRTLTVNDEAALQHFSRIDIRNFTRLETKSERIEIITPHTSGSFRINDSDRKNLVIEITNPAEFWKSSKFLVVRVR